MCRRGRAKRGFDATPRSPDSPRWLRVAAVFVLGCAVAAPALAQAELQGRVFAGDDRRPVTNAEIAVPRLNLRTVTDSLGRYRLPNVPRGEYVVVTRAAGFRPDSAVTAVDGDETLVNDVLLKPSLSSLEEVRVIGKDTPVMRGRLAGFHDRKAAGIGHFFGRDALEGDRERRLSDVLAGKVPGVAIHRGHGGHAWAATGRANSNAVCGLCKVSKADILDQYDAARGAPLACYMDVYLDGAVVYSTGALKQAPLFNLDRLDPTHLEGVEVYASAAQVPSQFIRTGNSCGVMLIWTRASR
jgi:CarboxypepD_reg-like domain